MARIRRLKSFNYTRHVSDWGPLITETSGDLRRLDHVIRFSSIPVVYQESTSQHSYWVSLYAALIHQEMGGKDDLIGPILLHAIGHDLRECVAGDVVRTLKYETHELKAEVDRAESLLSERLLGERAKKFLLLMDSIAANPYIKAIVKAADFLSLYQYMRREALRGNIEIMPFYFRMCKDLNAMAKNTEEHEFPSTFYSSIRKEALHIARTCFRGLQTDHKLMRNI